MAARTAACLSTDEGWAHRHTVDAATARAAAESRTSRSRTGSAAPVRSAAQGAVRRSLLISDQRPAISALKCRVYGRSAWRSIARTNCPHARKARDSPWLASRAHGWLRRSNHFFADGRRCGHPGQQHGRRLPWVRSSTIRSTCFCRVSSVFTIVTQQIHSLRASCVMFSHAASASAFARSAWRMSSGSSCTTPPEISCCAMGRTYTPQPWAVHGPTNDGLQLHTPFAGRSSRALDIRSHGAKTRIVCRAPGAGSPLRGSAGGADRPFVGFVRRESSADPIVR